MSRRDIRLVEKKCKKEKSMPLGTQQKNLYICKNHRFIIRNFSKEMEE